LKQAAAELAAKQVQNGMIVGLGTGSTAYFLVAALGQRVKAEGLRITGVPTSEKTAAQAQSLGIPLSDLDHHPQLDLTIDGADEVERNTLNLIKGMGGALLREKIVASASTRFLIIVDESKLVDHLCSHSSLPVEVIPFGWQATERRIRALGCTPTLRQKDGKEFLTDGGHYILDCAFPPVSEPAELERDLNNTVGVVEHGLFLSMASEVLVAGASGVNVLTRK